jgi:membrane fusion protein (multidrug efflux system)
MNDAASAAAEARTDNADSGPAKPWLRRIGIGAAILLAIALAIGGFFWWRHARHYESTDDAFIDGNVTRMAPLVSGRVIELMFADNQHVAAGQPLLRIDPRDFRVRLDIARAAGASAAADLAQAKAQATVQQSAVDQAGANIRVAEAAQVQAEKDHARLTALDPKAVTRQEVDSATAALNAANARLDAARQAEAGARAQLATAQARITAAEAARQQADANVEAAELQLSYATITAPTAGRVTHRTVTLGDVVSPGQALFAIVQDGLWVTANFKESQLADMRRGQRVDIRVDAVPGRHFQGRIDSIQAGTGSAFSVLPAENATGNYVKVVQRIPVKIVIEGDIDPVPALSPGMSVVPTVTVR